MLQYTFQHITGFGALKELDLWKKGVFSWADYVKRNSNQLSIFHQPEDELLKQSFEALKNKDADFFASRLPSSEFYRVALTFPEDVMFLDIETTGLSRYYNNITVIGWAFLDKFGVCYNGYGIEEMVEAFNKAKCIVTFNGSIFDLPFIKKEYPELKFPVCHIDLRFFSKRFGYSGGQKKIEAKIGYNRSQEALKIKGEFAPILWHRYKEGSLDALERLIDYNKFDIDGMKALLDICIEKSLSKQKIKPPISPFSFSSFPSNLKFSRSSGKKKSIFIKPFQGRVGPAITLEQLPKFEDISIVGIDLTGSESKPSGWCHLLYNNAITKQIKTDAELIEETIKTNPTIISIDSPLSMPEGRISVFDDDPGRQEFGIMRLAERILKKRGVSVYPALIPSMQRLTKRGTELAMEFRRRGYPVIESYPGAAQDILDIPRKGDSLEYLVKGLISFGIRGEFEHTTVSHDELDAITSAMVGYFFWCGKFEALGNDIEDYLIIPDVKTHYEYWNGKKVIGLSGGLASGKTTAGEYLKKKGFSYGRFSEVITATLIEQNKEVNRKNQQELGDQINLSLGGQRWLCKNLFSKIIKDNTQIVVDGMRFPEDYAYLKERFGPHFSHLHLTCKDTEREKRYAKDKRNSEVPFDVAISHHVERAVNNLKHLADEVIDNSGNLPYLYSRINKLIS